MIFWNGKSSDDVRVIVERYPNRMIPARKIETISVPGRNGDLLIVQDAWENYTQSYDIYISAEREKLPLMAHAAARWLSKEELFDVEWLPADIGLIKKIQEIM